MNSYLEFSSGINIVTGQSNNGKTAILRALDWIISNRPQGLSFKSNFSNKKDTCSVALTINNQEIVREKNNTINLYKLNNLLFDTIGNDVPIEIASAINISDINIGKQFEKHFLILDTPGEIGRTINKIVKLEDIDTLISSISSKISSTNKEIELKKQDIDKLNTSLEKFKDYDSIEILVNQIIENDIKIKDLERKVKVLNYIFDESNRVEKLIQSLENNYDTLEKQANELEQSWLTYNTNIKIIQDLFKLVNTIDALNVKIQDAEVTLNGCDALQDIEEKLIKYSVGLESLNQINNLIINWNIHYDIIKKNDKLIEKYEKEFETLLKDYACPLCGKKS